MRRQTVGPASLMRPRIGRRKSLGSARNSLGATSRRATRNTDQENVKPKKNRRQSMVPRLRAHKKRMSNVGGKRNSSVGIPRPSLPAATGRRSSIGTTKGAPSRGGRRESMSRRASNYADKRSDPRKLSDKTYMQQSVRKLILFLAQHNYDQPISPKVLTRPSNKDYFNILKFLLKKIDPHLVSTRGKRDFTKFVPDIFKDLKYPFNVSKAALTFVGVPHTWPSVLGTLSWLVELLSYDEAVETAKDGEDDFESQPEKIFFSYLRRSYTAFLEGNDDECQAIEDEVKSDFVGRNEQIKKAIEGLKSQIERFEEEHAKLEGTEAYIVKMRNRKSDYSEDLQKFKALIEKLDSHTVALEKKMKSRERHATEQTASLKAVQKERDRLRFELENQDLSPADVQRMTHRRKQLKYALSSLRTNVHDREQKCIWELEIAQTKKIEELGAAIRTYNDTLHNMELAPSNAKYAAGKDLQVDFNVCYSSLKKSLTTEYTNK